MTPPALLAIESLTDENLALRERVASLEADMLTYRALLLAAIELLRTMTLERSYLCRRVEGLVEMLRQIRSRERSLA